MQQSPELLRTQRLLIASGALLIFAGGVAGFGFLFFLTGQLNIWPLPVIEMHNVPGSVKAWRMTHLEGVLGGLIHWMLAALLPLLPFAVGTLRKMSIGMILVGWMFTIASSMDALFPDSRGLIFGGPLSNKFAFTLFYIGIVIVMFTMLAIAWRSLFPKDRQGTDPR